MHHNPNDPNNPMNEIYYELKAFLSYKRKMLLLCKILISLPKEELSLEQSFLENLNNIANNKLDPIASAQFIKEKYVSIKDQIKLEN